MCTVYCINQCLELRQKIRFFLVHVQYIVYRLYMIVYNKKIIIQYPRFVQNDTHKLGLAWVLPGMDLLGGGGGGGGGGLRTPLALARGSAGGVLFFMIEQKRQNEIQ